MERNTIRAGKGLSAVTVVKTRQVAGTTYHQAAWWGLEAGGYPLAGPCSSQRGLRHEIAQLRRLIASGVYTPR